MAAHCIEAGMRRAAEVIALSDGDAIMTQDIAGGEDAETGIRAGEVQQECLRKPNRAIAAPTPLRVTPTRVVIDSPRKALAFVGESIAMRGGIICPKLTPTTRYIAGLRRPARVIQEIPAAQR
jgi:hypothetical protein